VDFSFLLFVGGNNSGCRRLIGVDTAAVPDTTNVASLNDLHKSTGMDMSDLDESGVKEEDMWCMEGHAFSGSLPFDSASCSTGVSMFINKETKFYIVCQNEVSSETKQLTIVAQQELIICRPEHAQWLGRFTASSELGVFRILSLRDGNTIETEQNI